MIEAVENHMPQTIIIDEIGTELEALAASTIAQRGVQLVGTAHGSTIESIIKNPSLQMLVGGIEVLNPVPLHSRLCVVLCTIICNTCKQYVKFQLFLTFLITMFSQMFTGNIFHLVLICYVCLFFHFESECYSW